MQQRAVEILYILFDKFTILTDDYYVFLLYKQWKDWVLLWGFLASLKARSKNHYHFEYIYNKRFYRNRSRQTYVSLLMLLIIIYISISMVGLLQFSCCLLLIRLILHYSYTTPFPFYKFNSQNYVYVARLLDFHYDFHSDADFKEL